MVKRSANTNEELWTFHIILECTIIVVNFYFKITDKWPVIDRSTVSLWLGDTHYYQAILIIDWQYSLSLGDSHYGLVILIMAN